MTTRSLVAPLERGDRLETLTLLALAAFVGAVQATIAVADILLALVLVGWAAIVVSRRETLSVPPVFWPLAALAGWTLVSTAFSLDPRASLIDSKQLVLFLLVPAAYRLARGPRADALVTVLITVGAVGAVVGVVQYGVLHYDNLGRRPQGTLGHYMTYSGIVMLVAVVATARLLFRGQDRPWTALVMPAILAALALTFTRSAWVGALVGVALLFVLRDRRLLGLLPVAAALFLAVAPAQITARLWSTFDLEDPTNRDWVAMLASGLQMVRDHPVTGVGPNMVKVVYAQYRQPDAVEPLNVHLHNVPMQLAAERGLPALGIWMWLLAVLVRDMLRLRGQPGIAALACAALGATAAMVAAGMFEYNFGDSEFLMLFLVVITLPYAAAQPEIGP